MPESSTGDFRQLVVDVPRTSLSVESEDLDGDGAFELVLTAAERRRVVYWNDLAADGAFAEASEFRFDGIGEVPTLHAVDLDNDRLHDIVGGDGRVWYARARREYEKPVQVTSASFSGTSLFWDAGSRPDLAWTAESSIEIWRNRGERQLELVRTLRSPPGTNYGELEARDLDGDGGEDLIRWFEAGPIVHQRNSDGRFPVWGTRVLEGAGVGQSRRPLIVDLDGDGGLDMVALMDGGRIALLYSFAVNAPVQPVFLDLPVPVPSPVRSAHLAVSDVDSDGRLDIAVLPDADPAVIQVFRQSDARLFEIEAERIPAKSRPGVGFLRDVTNDGLPDFGSFGSDASLSFVTNQTPQARSRDLNWDGIPDECQARFRRGDSNSDGRIDISDAVFSLQWLFTGGDTPPCLDAADVDDSGSIDLTDGHLINLYLFLGGAPPVSVGSLLTCQVDPSVDDLGCESSTCP